MTSASADNGIPILEDSVSTDSRCSWDDSTTVKTGIFNVVTAVRELSASRILQSLLRFRWRLSRTLFSKPIVFFTAELNIKVGDIVVLFPVVLALVLVSTVQTINYNVKNSGISSSIALAAVFGLVVRNNALLLVITGISFERALFYHKLLAFITITLTALHGLAYILARNNGQIERNPKVASGMIAFIAMVMLYLLSLGCVRRRFYRFFVRSHWILFIVILVSAVLHGSVIALVGILPWELDVVYRLVYRSRVYNNGTIFGRKSGSLSNDLNTRTATKNTNRLGVAAQDQLEIFQLPDDITCIRFPRVRPDTEEEFKYKAGQYAFLCVPILSSLEWHPFCFSSSPCEDYVTFHSKAVGDWTMKLLLAAPEARNEGKASFEVLIDGPYGNLSVDIEDMVTYSHFVIFVEDMGVTSMRSIVNWLYSQCYSQKPRSLHRLRFIWSVSDSEILRAALMRVDIGRMTRDPYLPDVLLCPTTLNTSDETFFTEIYLTRGLAGAQIPPDPRLRKCLWFNRRPDTGRILREMGQQATKLGKSRIAVLVSGTESMAKEVIEKTTRSHFDHNATGYESDGW
ncbi:hypothetical protein F441_02992 [Phytophthora nicotianae CJ01A1]|uniref:FAD-binding FR-type domain-containing protein n=1 Tax=Phytophthora nicotianae CJ01A1 TaxID=1317063 RepID=W2XPT9_PHYNI|nr:hypothetical protein F441_02992 [Phytophthora nicotianae CJ01A1]